MTPAVLEQLPSENLPALRTVVSVAEDCPAELVQRWAKGRRFFNAYGPAETSSLATVEESVNGSGQPSLGKPVANTQVYVLDEEMQPVPVGVAGEVCIGGIGVARGYLRGPALTAERFVPNPFGEPGQRLYKTGDLARHLPDGRLERLGRVENQIQLRDLRVEPRESVEKEVAEHEYSPTATVH
jgi:non-ribosomal peptide synthetase component F